MRNTHPYALLWYPFYWACFPVFTLWYIFIVLIPRIIYHAKRFIFRRKQSNKHIVIIGGGFSGSIVAQQLQNEFDVSLIDTKDYYEFTPSVLRTIVEPNHIRGIQVLHTRYLKHTNIIQAQVQKIFQGHIELSNRTIPFDYLVICSGSNYQQPFKESSVIAAARANNLRESYYAIRKKETILIIGGGIVGVELAAEIVSRYKSKQVILVHSQESVINRFPKRAIKCCQDFLVRHGVQLILNERVTQHKDWIFVTNKGREIKCDMAFLCTGISPNSSLLKTEFSDTVSESGYIEVNDFLQLKGKGIVHQNIFVAGDVVNMNEEKLAQAAEMQGYTVAENIRKIEEGGKHLKRYQPGVKPVLISLGKFHAVFVWGNIVVTGPFPALLKEAVEWKTLVRYW